jgi:hypothetical protein
MKATQGTTPMSHATDSSAPALPQPPQREQIEAAYFRALARVDMAYWRAHCARDAAVTSNNQVRSKGRHQRKRGKVLS